MTGLSILSALICAVLLLIAPGCGSGAEEDSSAEAEAPPTADLSGTWSGIATISGMPDFDLEVAVSIHTNGEIYFTGFNSRGHYDCQASGVFMSDSLLKFDISDGDMDTASVSLAVLSDSLYGNWGYTATPDPLGGEMFLHRTSAEALLEDELFALDDFVPVDLQVPAVLETDRFRLRMLTAEDVELDFEAVMSSAEQLREMSGGSWPSDSMTLEDNLHDLIRHQAEFEAREAFTYTVVNLDEDSVLGCVYINPPWGSVNEYDAVVAMWVRSSELETGLDSLLFEAVDNWFKELWPFENILYM